MLRPDPAGSETRTFALPLITCRCRTARANGCLSLNESTRRAPDLRPTFTASTPFDLITLSCDAAVALGVPLEMPVHGLAPERLPAAS